jgi:hypothetical protein
MSLADAGLPRALGESASSDMADTGDGETLIDAITAIKTKRRKANNHVQASLIQSYHVFSYGLIDGSTRVGPLAPRALCGYAARTPGPGLASVS